MVVGIIGTHGSGCGGRLADPNSPLDEDSTKGSTSSATLDAAGLNLNRLGGAECGKFLYGSGDHVAPKPV